MTDESVNSYKNTINTDGAKPFDALMIVNNEKYSRNIE
jgi:hypothetical protein